MPVPQTAARESTAHSPLPNRSPGWPRRWPRARLYTLAILGAALLLRLWIVWIVQVRLPQNWFFTRGLELGLLAKSLSTGQGLSSPFGGATGPTAYLAPGYPWIVSLFFRAFGSYTPAAGLAIMLLQTVFAVATLAVLMHLARTLFGNAAANVAGILWTLSLPVMWMPSIFWESCLSTLLLVSFVALAMRCRRRPSLWTWLAMGAFSAGAVLVNPALLLALGAIAGWTTFETGRRPQASPQSSPQQWTRPLLAPALALVVFVALLAPWPVRNARLFHAFIPLRSNFGFELWNGNQPGTDGLFRESLHPYYNPQELALYVSQGEVRYMQQKSALAKQSIREHAGEFVRVSLKRVWRFWTGSAQPTGVRQSMLVILCTSFTSLFGLLGLVLVWKRWPSLGVLFALPLLVFPAPYYITHPDVRFRLVLEPLLAVLSAYALTRVVAEGGSGQATGSPAE